MVIVVTWYNSSLAWLDELPFEKLHGLKARPHLGGYFHCVPGALTPPFATVSIQKSQRWSTVDTIPYQSDRFRALQVALYCKQDENVTNGCNKVSPKLKKALAVCHEVPNAGSRRSICFREDIRASARLCFPSGCACPVCCLT